MHRKITEAIGGLVAKHHFFAMQVLRLEFVEDSTCETAWTDGITMGYNPRFIDSLELDEVKFLLAHEGPGHNGFLHHVRVRGKDRALFNKAGDYVVNLWLKESGFMLPDGVLLDYRFRNMSVEQVYSILEKEMEAEQESQDSESTSDETEEGKGEEKSDGDGAGNGGDGETEKSDRNTEGLPDNTEGGNQEPEGGNDAAEGGNNDGREDVESGGNDRGSESGSGEGKSGEGSDSEGVGDTEGGEVTEYSRPDPSRWGEVREFQGKNPETGEPREATGSELNNEEERWRNIVTQSFKIASKLEGREPGFAKSLVDAHSNPRMPWREMIARWLTEKVATDYNFMRPNTRYSHTGFFMPSLEATDAGHIVIIFDESGSMDTRDQEILISETKSIMQQFGDCKVTILCVNTEVTYNETFESLHDLPEGGFPFSGGGTDFKPGFLWIEENLVDDPPAGVIYMTDGECSSFPDEPPYETLWMVTRLPRYAVMTPPFGEVAHFDEY